MIGAYITYTAFSFEDTDKNRSCIFALKEQIFNKLRNDQKQSKTMSNDKASDWEDLLSVLSDEEAEGMVNFQSKATTFRESSYGNNQNCGFRTATELSFGEIYEPDWNGSPPNKRVKLYVRREFPPGENFKLNSSCENQTVGREKKCPHTTPGQEHEEQQYFYRTKQSQNSHGGCRHWTQREKTFLVGIIFDMLYRKGSLSATTREKQSNKSVGWNEIKEKFDLACARYQSLNKTGSLVSCHSRTKQAMLRHYKVLKNQVAKEENDAEEPLFKRLHNDWQMNYNKNNILTCSHEKYIHLRRLRKEKK